VLISDGKIETAKIMCSGKKYHGCGHSDQTRCAAAAALRQ